MTKRPSKPTRKPLKRGPKEERLIITDPESALDKLLQKPQPRPATPGHDGSLETLLKKQPPK